MKQGAQFSELVQSALPARHVTTAAIELRQNL
jgi:hypothetical protein